MKKLMLACAAFAFFASMTKQSGPKPSDKVYPKTEKRDCTATYFGVIVQDPYKWLEDDRSEETMDWVKRQNAYTFNYLDQIPYQDRLKLRMSELWNYEKVGSPFYEGGVKYYYKNNGLQNQYVLFTERDGKEEIFLDPNTFAKDGTTSLGNVSFSKDGSIVAYAISEGGSDWRKIIVMDVKSKKIIEDTLIDVKFSGISWYKNEGFYYSSYDKPKGSELSAKTDQHKLYYHKLGTAQKSDEVIFGNSAEEKRRYVGGDVTEDNHYLFITAAVSTYGNELYMIDLESKERNLITIVGNFDNDSYVMENDGNRLFIVTDYQAPNKRVIVVDAENPGQENWVDLIAEKNFVLTPSNGGGYFFAHYMNNAISQVIQYDYEGHKLREIALPGIGTARGFSGKKEDKTLYFSFTNYHTPGSTFKLDPNTGAVSPYWTPKISFKKDDYESKQVFYKSKDGTQIPMIITYKKGTELNGKNPTILYGYGGFNISLTPSFKLAEAVWMEYGGIYAVPNLRGGGEYGKDWHKAGTQMQKQNVFDDFIAAAEYLIENKYTSSEYLAIKGRSNGGLLVGAVMTQRPDLMKVALPGVGVLDMLRYHTFTAGAGWAYDYGTAEDSKEMFEYLLAYSPVHNVKEGVNYPATMVTTGDHDDRVVPAHSFKFISELQAKQAGENPVIIRIETNAGHGAGTPVSKQIDAAVDEMCFTLWNMGIKEL